MHSPARNQLWCPGQSLWSLIADHVSDSELLKIRSAMGHHLVGMYTDMHTEAGMWHKMWQWSQRDGNHSSRPETAFTHLQGFPLADPPVVKELVRAEVKMLLQTLRETACREGRDLEELLIRYKPETVNYALGHQDICYSDCTNSENMETHNRPSSHCSVQSSVEDEIEEIRDKLNATEIHKVVSHLRSVLLEECKALTAMIKYLKENMKQKHLNKCDKSEPSLSELKELRGALQEDLKLFPSSLESLSPLPVKVVKNSFRLPGGQWTDTLLPLTPTSVSRSPTPLCHFKPKPPSGHPPNKTSLIRTHSAHRLTSTSNKSINPLTCNNIDSSGHPNSSLSSEQKMVQSKYHCSLSPEQDDAAGVCYRTYLSVHTNCKRNSPFLETHLSTQCCIHRPSTEYNLSLQRERKKKPAWSSRNIDITPSPPPTFTHLCDAESYSNNDTDKEGKVMPQSRQQSSISGGSSEEITAQTDKCLKTKCLESSVIPETLAQDVGRRSNSGINIHKADNITKAYKQTAKHNQPHPDRLGLTFS
ncbi:coiled-coil domain-containing protein 24 [Melanotaenia boesemani]|uniref:coiled-coil domain-containing protein 24 n=1 Tax=Melanotaenia boesemani TaxID=1250792 RepID=UPI001C0495E1|nr:coiled-coil domain-containing protein 24 [Melanotaenia boesemani]